MKHQRFRPERVWQQVDIWVQTNRERYEESNRNTHIGPQEKYVVEQSGMQIIVDASWDSGGKVGTAHVVYVREKLKKVHYNYHTAADPFEAEARALLEALKEVTSTGQAEGPTNIFSDCLSLRQAVTDGDIDTLPSWRALPMVTEAIAILERAAIDIHVHHARREAVRPAHILANLARRNEVMAQGGNQDQVLCQVLGIGSELDKNFFQLV